MGFFTSIKNGWYELNDFNLSGTGSGGLDYDLKTVGTWTSVARFDNEEVDLNCITYRSAIQEDGAIAYFKPSDATGTSLLSLRILPPNSNVGLSIFSDLGLTGTSQIGVTEANFIPSRSIPKNSLLQAKITGEELEQIAGTNNRLHIRFNYTYSGVDPQITSLLDY